MTIKINVGGTIFETTIETIKKINYINYVIQDTNIDLTKEILFINRSPHIFKHVLAFAIDDNYKYPSKYKEELDFYDMQYDESNLFDQSKEMVKYVGFIEQKLVNDKYNYNYDNKCSRLDCDNITYNFVCEEHEFKCDYPFVNIKNIYYCDDYTNTITIDNKHYRCTQHI